MSDTFNTTVANWQGVDDKPIAGSDNLVKSGGVISGINEVLMNISRTSQVRSVNIRNGSQGNPLNPYVVCTEYIPINGFDIITLETTRPVSSNSKYTYGYVIVSAADVIGANPIPNLSRSDIVLQAVNYTNGTTYYNKVNVSSYPNAVAISFVIAEYTNSNTQNTLRTENFSGYEIKISSQVNIGHLTKILRGKNLLIDNRIGFGNKPLRIEETYSSGKSIYILDTFWAINFYNTTYTYSSNTSFANTYNLSLATSVKGFQNCIEVPHEYCFVYNVLDNKFYIKSNSKILLDDIILVACYNGRIGYISDTLETNLVRDIDMVDMRILKDGVVRHLYNGSYGNRGNGSAVSTCGIPIVDKSSITINISRPNSQDCHYRYGFAISDNELDANSESVFFGNLLASKGYTESSAINNTIDLSAYPNAKVIVFSIAERHNNSDTYNTLRITDFANYEIKVSPISISEIADKHIDLFCNNVVKRNESKRIALANTCMVYKREPNKRDFMVELIADTHKETLSVKNAVSLSNGIDMIDAIIHCGDMQEAYYTPEYVSVFQSVMNSSTKPWFLIIGNHDVGNHTSIIRCCTHRTAYSSYTKPMVDAGILKSGEYTEWKPYYFHDFLDKKVRFIGLYEYDSPLDILDNQYWEKVTYNSSYNSMEVGVTYTYDENNPIILNCGDCIDYSFRLIKTVTTSVSNISDDTMPLYRICRGYRVMQEEQINWFINVLNSTPEGYAVIVGTHNSAMINSTNQASRKFAINNNQAATYGGAYYMTTDIISDIVNAFINSTTLNEHVIMNGDAAYLNTQNDGSIDYCYDVSADFSNKNAETYFACYVGGHYHMDAIFKHNSYNGQYSINPICGITEYHNNKYNDVARPRTDCVEYDALTCVSIAKNRIGLARIGNDKTIYGEDRDIEFFNPND